jgi:hypothetical protein
MLAQRLGLVLVGSMALASIACAPRGAGEARQPLGHVEVKRMESPDDAPEQAKTVQVSYIFDRDVVNKDFDKTFKDGFEKKGIRVDEELSAHAHFGVSRAKITGTVTYVKKAMGRFSILDADLVAEAHYDADVQVDLDVKVKGETKKASAQDWDGTALGGKPFTLVKNVMPTNIPIAGPLFLHAHFDLTAACDLGVEGQMHATTGVGIKGDVRLAAKYKKAGFEHSDGKKSRFAFEAKTPTFELAPRPYLRVDGKQQSVKGKCSLQPTAVLLLEHSVGAKLMVEPWVELDASRPTSRSPWKLDAQAGVSVHAATDIELFGRQMRKPKEFTLFEVALTRKGDAMGSSPRLLAPSRPANGRPAAPSDLAPRAPAEGLRLAAARPPLAPFAAPGRPRAPPPAGVWGGGGGVVARPPPRPPAPSPPAEVLRPAAARPPLDPFAAPGRESEPPSAADPPRTASDASATAEPAEARPATTDTTDARPGATADVRANTPAAAEKLARAVMPDGDRANAEASAPAPAEPSAAPAAVEPTRKSARGSKKTRGASATASRSAPEPRAAASPLPSSASTAAKPADPLLEAALAASPAKKVGRKPNLASLGKAVRRN